MRKIIYLLILSSAGFGASDAYAQTPGQYTNGNRCKSQYGSEESSFSSAGARLLRLTSTGGGNKYVTCPATLNEDDFSGNVLTARVHITHVANTSITCGASSYDQFGAFVNFCGSHNYVGPLTSVWLDIGGNCSLGAGAKIISIWCSLPENSFVDYYEYYMAP